MGTMLRPRWRRHGPSGIGPRPQGSGAAGSAGTKKAPSERCGPGLMLCSRGTTRGRTRRRNASGAGVHSTAACLRSTETDSVTTTGKVAARSRDLERPASSCWALASNRRSRTWQPTGMPPSWQSCPPGAFLARRAVHRHAPSQAAIVSAPRTLLPMLSPRAGLPADPVADASGRSPAWGSSSEPGRDFDRMARYATLGQGAMAAYGILRQSESRYAARSSSVRCSRGRCRRYADQLPPRVDVVVPQGDGGTVRRAPRRAFGPLPRHARHLQRERARGAFLALMRAVV